MPNEIAKCPMKGCGGECSLGYGEFVGDLLVDRVGCNRCAYRGASSAVAGEAIAAHNELATAAEVGRLLIALAAEGQQVAVEQQPNGQWDALLDGWTEDASAALTRNTLLDALRGLKEES